MPIGSWQSMVITFFVLAATVGAGIIVAAIFVAIVSTLF